MKYPTLKRIAVIAAFLLMGAGTMQAQFAQNGTTTSSVTFTNLALTATVAHTTPALANRFMIVAIHMNVNNSTAAAITSVTYNNVPLTLSQALTEAGNDVRTEMWTLLAPATGNHNVVVTAAGVTAGNPNDAVIGVTTYVDVNQTLGLAQSYAVEGNNATPTSTLTGLTANDMVVDFASARQNAGGTLTATIGAGQTAFYNTYSPNAQNNDDVLAVASRETAAGANVTTSYTLNSTQEWVKVGGRLRAISTDVEITGYATPDLLDGSPSTVTFVYTITTQSAGANNVNFSNTLPAGLTIVSATPSQGTCTPATTTACSLGTLLNAGDTATITIVATSGAGTIATTYNTSSTITSGTTDAIAGNNSVTVSVRTESHICANPGADGSGGTITGSVNTYYPGNANAAAGATSITVTTAVGPSNIAIGDLLLVIQMQDATIDANNDDRYGDGAGNSGLGTPGNGSLNLNSAGRYEYVVATNTITTAGGTINITGAGNGAGLLYSYTNAAAAGAQGQRRFQVVRVPQYTIATLAAGASAPAWNGRSGGIFAIDVAGTLTMGSAAGTGTVSTTTGSTTVTGTATTFTAQIHSGDSITINGEGTRNVLFVTSNTSLELTTAATTTGAGRSYTVPQVSLSGLGFRGGAGRQLAGGTGANTDYVTTAANNTNGSKGEGIAGTPRYLFANSATILDTTIDGYPNGSSGRGAPSNAGGGGTDGNPVANDQNSGGGGGGNAGTGGNGGNAWNSAAPSGGFGGAFEAPSTTRVILGGGGGAGSTNNGTSSGTNLLGTGVNSSGVAGGGIVIIRANSIAGTGTISANGSNALDVLNDAGGGGGAGGTVIIDTRFGSVAGLTISAKGGRGGNAWLIQGNPAAPNDFPGERHGPGGGGGGGAIYLSAAGATTDVSGGASGRTTTALDNFGASDGAPGVLASPISVVPGADATYNCALADLVVTNTDSPDPVVAGSNITYAQTLTNNGPRTADQVIFSTAIPASTSFQSISVPAGWTCITPAIGAGGVVTCTTPTLASGATANFSLVVQAHVGTPAGYIISNTANATSQTNESNYANNTATTTTAVITAVTSDVRVVITAPATVVVNTNYNYVQTVTNGGGATATGLSFTESTPPNTTFQGITPPAGWTCITPAIGGTGSITCSAASLAAGASVSIPMTLKVNTGTLNSTVVTETATISSTSTDANLSNNTSAASTTVVGAGTADLAATVTALTNPTTPGSLFSFAETVTNNGVVASGGSFTQTVPANSTFVSMVVPAGWTCVLPAVGAAAGTAIPCTSVGTIAVGATASFTPTFQVVLGTAAGTVITQSATIATTGGITDSIAANNTASATTIVQAKTSTDLAITKTASPNPVGQGQLVTYLLTVVNNGPGTATGVTVSDTLPAGMSLISASPSAGSCSGAATITCTIGSLAVRGTATVSIVVQASTLGTISNTATVTGAQTDPVPANNSSTAPVTVLSVTLIRLRNFTATQDKNRVAIAWQTSFEQDNLGFNIYREIGGQRVQVNKGLIAGSALTSKKHNETTDRTYRLIDKLAASTTFAQYWLEDVDIRGVHTLHGPVTPYAGVIDQPGNTTALAGLGAHGAVIDSPAGYGILPSYALATPAAAQLSQQTDLAAGNALKIYVAEDGWQRVTRAAMTAAGFDPGSDSKSFTLYMAGSEQPMLIDDGGDGKFDPSDAIEFYGQPLDTISTGARTYWLRVEKGTTKRMAVAKTKGGDPITGNVSFDYQKEERSVFFAALISNGEASNFFGPVITTEPVSQDVTINRADLSFAGNATLALTIQGGTDTFAHAIRVTFAGHDLGSIQLDGQALKTFTFPFPHSWLTNGVNQLTLTSLNGDDDVSTLATTRVSYQHVLRADNGALEVTLPAGRSVTIGGFTEQHVRALDISDPQHPAMLETTVAADPQGGYAANFTVPSDSTPRKILAFDSTRVVTPPEVTANHPSAWAASKGADLVIITNSAFAAAAATLPPVRNAQGISTAVVDVDNVYDEFNFGIRDPQAIRAFMQNAAKSWKTVPRWLLLVGDASIDPRNYMGLGAYDFLPTKLVATTYLKTASDEWLGDVNGDGIADVAVGRIPVRTADEAALVFAKITSRGTPSGTWANNVLLVADQPTDFDFGAAASSLVPLLPSTLTQRTIDFTRSSSPHSDVLSAMNDGQLLVDYIGHGSVEMWSESVVQSPDAFALANGNRLPFVVAMECLNGYFHDVYTESLAEALLKAPNGGAVAVWASSTLTQPDQQALMNRELFRALFSGQPVTIGEAVKRARLAASDPDVRKSWILFGDPSMRLK
jgi:uncharacterized repeat protein (TIGR01451 family)